MMMSELRIRRVQAVDERMLAQLAEVTKDCVDAGASIGFMHPFTDAHAITFWRKVAGDVAAGRRLLLVAEDDGGVCGTVQLIVDMPDNQPHSSEERRVGKECRDRRGAESGKRRSDTRGTAA